MKMTDVITGLRDLVPELKEAVQIAERSSKEASEFAEDLRACRTTSGVLALADATAVAAVKTLADVRRCLVVAGRLAALEQSYKRQFRDQADARQPDLPGLELDDVEVAPAPEPHELEPRDLDPED